MPRELVVWPNYIDAEKSRRMGRRIPRKKAVPAPRVKEIVEAALELGLGPRAEEDKAYPREWWGAKGRVLIIKSSPKGRVLRAIAETIKKRRSEKS